MDRFVRLALLVFAVQICASACSLARNGIAETTEGSSGQLDASRFDSSLHDGASVSDDAAFDAGAHTGQVLDGQVIADGRALDAETSADGQMTADGQVITDASESMLDSGEVDAFIGIDAFVEPDGGCQETYRACSEGVVEECIEGSIRTTPCVLGCRGDRCADLAPSSIDDTSPFDRGSLDLWVRNDETALVHEASGLIEIVDTTDRTLIRMLDPSDGYGYFDQGGGGENRRVFVFGSITVEPLGRVEFVEETDRAIVMLARGPIVMSGLLDLTERGELGATADSNAGGDGRGRDGSAGPLENIFGGGAGASYGSRGGAGADGEWDDERGGSARPRNTYGRPELTPPFRGSGGGRGGGAAPGFGGRGGGAIQLGSSTSISIEGVIEANGGGGGSGTRRVRDSDTEVGGGGGGGSGGSILLEAPRVTVLGLLRALGGGGGRGTCNYNPDPGCQNGPSEGRGETLRFPAPGPALGDPADLQGGGGGDASNGEGNSPEELDGGDGTTLARGGGGAGGAGRIRINTLEPPQISEGRVFPTLASQLATTGTIATTAD